MTDPQNAGTTYVYDTLNRLTSLTSPQGAFGFSYDALSRRTQLTRPNNVSTTYGYDSLSRLLSVLHTAGTTTLDGATYSVDAAGNRTARIAQPSNTTTNYAYDSIYQLTQATQGGSTTESYTYDPVGNRLSSLAVSSYSYNSSNEMTAAGAATYTYDNNGNPLTKTDSTGTITNAWDFENRLTSITLPGSGGTVSFKYDPFGRRIYKSSLSGTSVFAYDADNLIEETSAAGAVVARYTQGLGIDEPLAELRSGTTSYYDADGLGSITSLSNSAGAIANTYAYDSFGNLTASTGTIVNPFRYTAREFDTETNLNYYRARFYDSISGRFLSEDRLRNVVGGMNFYLYVKNNAPNFIDPDGQAPEWPLWTWWDRFFRWVGYTKDVKDKSDNVVDWSLCGVYYVECLDTGMGIKRDIAKALNSPDPVVYATALATLAQQTNSNSVSQLNINVCMQNENCKKALECAKKGLTNPLPFPSL
jgi:RHS repeat-associated protein